MEVSAESWDRMILLRAAVERFLAHYDKIGPGTLGNGKAMQFYSEAKRILEK